MTDSTGRILVVDDNRFVRLILTAMLEKHGHSTLQASCGKDALEMTKHNPDSKKPRSNCSATTGNTDRG